MRVVRSKDNATAANIVTLGRLEVIKLGLDLRLQSCV